MAKLENQEGASAGDWLAGAWGWQLSPSGKLELPENGVVELEAYVAAFRLEKGVSPRSLPCRGGFVPLAFPLVPDR
jgi:hypothetical protein